MKIGARVIEKEDKVETGRFLEIKIDTAKVEIPLSDFLNKYKEEIEKTASALPEVSFMVEEAPLNPINIDSEIDLSRLIFFILEKFSLTREFETQDEELVVDSGLEEFLSLPWEIIVTGGVPVFRELYEDAQDFNEKTNNFLVLLSRSHVPDKRSLGKDPDDEILEMLKCVLDNNKPPFRVEKLHLVKHTTTESLRSSQLEDFDVMHLIMHGEKDGSLCLEDSRVDNYKSINHLSKKDFLDLLQQKGVANTTLMFLSFCFSGGDIGKNGLPFELVKLGISRNVIAYNGTVNSPSAKLFAGAFYKQLFSGGRASIRDAYKYALSEFSVQNPERLKEKFVPTFYARRTILSDIKQ